jgi:CD2 antigen cytoplasmic tail-binding protein 2
MSSRSSNNGNKKGDRSVRFANDTVEPSTVKDTPASKRRRVQVANPNSDGRMSSIRDDGDHENYDDDDRKPAAVSNFDKSSKKKSKKKYFQNEDELDDIDDWNEELDDGVDGGGGLGGDGIIASERKLIEAKRKRRQKRGGMIMEEFEKDDDDGRGSATVDHHAMTDEDYEDMEGERSLKTEGIKFEPFHMRDEEEDGTGYFDGDTYVFRRNPNDDGEPDAWADSLNDPEQDIEGDQPSSSSSLSKQAPQSSSTVDNSSAGQENLDELTKEELYGRMYHLISGTESVAKAIQRYGKIVKQEQNQKRKMKKTKANDETTTATQHEVSAAAASTAKSCLDKITGAANALLLQGDVDIYQTTSNDIRRKYPSIVTTAGAAATATNNTTDGVAKTTRTAAAAAPSSGSSKTQWEYVGNENEQIQGPFTTEQMLGWVQAGYFVGTQRVKIRTIQEEELSTEDDLLADLMDDDDDDEEEEEDGDGDDPNPNPTKKPKRNLVRGEWMWSNEVDYKSFL